MATRPGEQRLGSAAGIDFALYVARIHLEDMGQERRQRFLEGYGWWIEGEIREFVTVPSPAVHGLLLQ